MNDKELQEAAEKYATEAYAKAPEQEEQDAVYIQNASFYSFIAGAKYILSREPVQPKEESREQGSEGVDYDRGYSDGYLDAQRDACDEIQKNYRPIDR